MYRLGWLFCEGTPANHAIFKIDELKLFMTYKSCPPAAVYGPSQQYHLGNLKDVAKLTNT
jgi:hypothetical protein